jgi:hypothetical protein
VHAWVPPVVGVVIGLALAIHARIRIGRIFAWFVNPLPEDIHTFRDLAELIVRHREQDMVAA